MRRRTALGLMEAWDLGQVLPPPSRLAPALVLEEFDFDKWDLKPSHLPKLKRLAANLVRRPPPLVNVVGHTDRVGTPAYNFGLGMRRALQVIEVLRREMQRLSPTVAARMLLVPLSFGETRPASRTRMELNRRVEIFFITPPASPPPPPPPPPPVPPREILDWAKKMLHYLQTVGGDPKLIERLKRLLDAAAPILGLAGAILGLYVFARGRLMQVALAEGMSLVRIWHRFETSGMKDQLERILRELTDPSLTRPLEEEVRRSQRRDPRGRFERKEPGEEPPGSLHEKEVCRRVTQRYPYSAEQVKIRRYQPRLSLPGRPARPGLVLPYPEAKVECVGSYSRDKGLILFEAKESGPPDLTNPGLTPAQRIVYPGLITHGGALVVSKGPFKEGTKLPRGTRVRIITPANLHTI